MNNLFFSVLYFSVSITSYGGNGLTSYKWKPNPEKKYSGKCYEVDAETGGEKYSKKVGEEFCRPKKKEDIYFLWEQKPDRADGECYAIDKATSGNSFAKEIGWRNCMPENIEKIMLEGKCYFKGETDLGNVFLMRVSKADCKPSENELRYTFVPDRKGLSGKCFALDPSSGDSFKEDLKKCHPGQTQFITMQNENFTDCYEVASEGGPAVYINKVNRENCRPTNLQVSWVQTSDFSGRCVQSTSDGSYQEPAEFKECAEIYKAVPQFLAISPSKGICLMVDKETKGGQLRKKVEIRDCRPIKVSNKLTFSVKEKSQVCIEYDPQDEESGYRDEVSLTKCAVAKNDYRWLPSKDNPFDGECLRTLVIGEMEKDKKVDTELCQPPKLKYVFHISDPTNGPLKGLCYGTHPEGPEFFSVVVGKKKCRPKETMLKYFHPEQYKGGGCFQVDKETMGVKYHKKEDEKKCKREFLNLPKSQ